MKATAIIADLSRPTGVTAVIACVTDDGPVSLLVDDAGFSSIRPLTGTPDETSADMITANVVALTQLSRAAISAFAERGGGTLMNIGSDADSDPVPAHPSMARPRTSCTG